MKAQRVFVSSVMRDYEDRRATAREAILELGMTPVMAEDVPAVAGSPRHVLLHQNLPSCDTTVAIYGNRYGWTGTQSGLSPTEEEFHRARELWIPIYVFIDRIQSGRPEPRQQDFLRVVEGWDQGLMRREFRSLEQLRQGVVQALARSDLSPRYRSFLDGIGRAAAAEGYVETSVTHLPAFDLLLHRESSTNFDSDSFIVVLNGDDHAAEQIEGILKHWRAVVQETYKTGFWRAKHFSEFVAVAVEANPNRLTPDALPEEHTWGQSKMALVDLATGQVEFSPRSWWKKPGAPHPMRDLLASALSGLR